MQLVLILLFGIVMTAHSQPPDSLWSFRYGNQYDDIAQSVIRTSSGFWLIAGHVELSDGFQYLTFVKLTDDGDTVWTRVYPSGWAGRNVGSMVPTDDDGCVAATYSGGSGYGGAWSSVVRFAANGDTVWTYDFDWSPYGWEGYILAPAICSTGGSDVLVCGDRWFPIDATWGVEADTSFCIRLSADGDSIWCHSYDLYPGSGTDPLEVPLSVIRVPTGYVFCGDAGTGGLLGKVNLSGSLQWSHVFPRSESYLEFRQLVSAEDGYAMVGGRDDDTTMSYQARLVKTNTSGDYQWHRDYGDLGYELGTGLTVFEGGYALAGLTRPLHAATTDALLLRTDLDGDSVWSQTFGSDDHETATGIALAPDGGVLLIGTTTPLYSSNADWWIVRVAPELEAGQVEQVPAVFGLTQNYPNPFNAATSISFTLSHETHAQLSVFDITGRVVATALDEPLRAGTHNVVLDASAWPSGIYLYQLQTDQFSQCRKMVVLK